MANIHVTTATTTPIQAAGSIILTVNAALTGTITVNDNTGVIAIITNPTVGNFFEYSHLQAPVTVVTSAACDITITQNARGIR